MHHYRLRLDRLEVDDVRFCTYGDHRGVHLFSDSVHLLGMVDVREPEGVPSFTRAGREAV